MFFRKEHRRSKQYSNGRWGPRKTWKKETRGYVRFRSSHVPSLGTCVYEPNPIYMRQKRSIPLFRLAVHLPFLYLQRYFNTEGARRDGVGGRREICGEEHALEFHGSCTGGWGETTAELELRSTINICRQWAAHISAASLPATPVLLPSLSSTLSKSSLDKREREGRHPRACVYTRECVHVSRGSMHMITGATRSPLLCVDGIRGHVCVTARLLPNVRCKFPLSRLTRSARPLSAVFQQERRKDIYREREAEERS